MKPAAKVAWLPALRGAVEKNLRRLMTEVRETGELSVLLSRAARGQKLTGDERRRMRAQLLDLARAIPALAIFAAPGGVVMLILLARVLPFSLLPSAFQEDPAAAPALPKDASSPSVAPHQSGAPGSSPSPDPPVSEPKGSPEEPE